MAKRKRLTPANPNFLGAERTPVPEPVAEPTATAAEKAAPRGRTRPPIAQVAGEASAASALDELAQTLQKARDEGRLIQSLPLTEIDTGHLVRDRLFADEEEMTALMESLISRGQQTPIEVVDRGEGASPRYGLISGWRRMAALGRLSRKDPGFGEVLALVRVPRSASDAYVAMVEENEIRVGLSYYERARIAVKAVEQGVYPDLKTALNGLFANVSRAKRSKIKSFTILVEKLDAVLCFPTAIGERMGLELAKRLEDPEATDLLRRDLEARPSENVQEEQLRLASPVGKPDGPASAAVPKAVVVEARLEASSGRIVLEGDGVDEALLAALQRWLKGRQKGG